MHIPGIQQVDYHQQIEHTINKLQPFPVPSAVSSDCYSCVALRGLMMALLLLSSSKYVFSRTDKETFGQVVGMDGVLVGRGMTLQRRNNCPVVRAHLSIPRARTNNKI